MMPHAALYMGTTHHRRLAPVAHAFTYRLFSLLLDLDALDSLDQRLRLFAVNRWGLLSFHDADHGAGDGTPVRDWARQHFTEAALAADRLFLLCFPRLWGLTFNPLAIYFAYDANGRWTGTLYQVSNTFGERHSYLLPAGETVARKVFHVSPFFDVQGHYRFDLRSPGHYLALTIRYEEGANLRLLATQSGIRHPLTDRTLAHAVLRHPLMTLKVVAAIHYEALRLWRKGVRVQPKPPPPAQSVSHVGKESRHDQ